MYDAYIIDDRQADRKHLRNLLVQYQIQNGVEARITGCTFADPLTPQTVTVMYLLDAADGRAQPVIAQVRAGQTQHHIVLTAPTFQQLIQAVTAETLPTGLLLKPVGAEELFRLLRAVEQPSVSQTQATYVWTVKARRYSIAQDAILYFESRSKKTFLVTAAQEYELSASLDALEAQLGSRFVRTHRSYLVNQRHILSYDAGTMTVTLDDESVVYPFPRGKSKTEGGFGMVTGYRFTEDEFVFLAYFYQCMTVPAWFLCEPEQIDPERRCGRWSARGCC